MQDLIFKNCLPKHQLDSVLLNQNSGNSRFIWFSVSFSSQKYTKKFSRIQKLAKSLQDIESRLFFHWIWFCNLFNKHKFASKLFSKIIVPWLIFSPLLISCNIQFYIILQASCKIWIRSSLGFGEQPSEYRRKWNMSFCSFVSVFWTYFIWKDKT